MEDFMLKKGKLVDELQLRITALKRNKKAPPKEWYQKLSELAEANDQGTIEKIYKWSLDLPAIELKTKTITWQTFTHFSGYFSDRLVILASKREIIDGKKPEKIIEAIKKLDAVPGLIDDPILAMAEYKKIRDDIANEYPKLAMEDL